MFLVQSGSVEVAPIKIENNWRIRDLSSRHSIIHHSIIYIMGFNFGPRNYFIPKIDMRKFDNKDPITWIFHMEQFFDLHQVPTLKKVTISSLN